MAIILKYYCPCCGNLSIANTDKKEVYTDNAKIRDKIYLTNIQCESCHGVITVQIDTDYTLELLEKQKKINTEIGKAKYKYGVSFHQMDKMENKLKHISQKLLKEREVLSKAYNNSDYYKNAESQEIIGTINYKNVITKITEE